MDSTKTTPPSWQARGREGNCTKSANDNAPAPATQVREAAGRIGPLYYVANPCAPLTRLSGTFESSADAGAALEWLARRDGNLAVFVARTFLERCR